MTLIRGRRRAELVRIGLEPSGIQSQCQRVPPNRGRLPICVHGIESSDCDGHDAAAPAHSNHLGQRLGYFGVVIRTVETTDDVERSGVERQLVGGAKPQVSAGQLGAGQPQECGRRIDAPHLRPAVGSADEMPSVAASDFEQSSSVEWSDAIEHGLGLSIVCLDETGRIETSWIEPVQMDVVHGPSCPTGKPGTSLGTPGIGVANCGQVRTLQWYNTCQHGIHGYTTMVTVASTPSIRDDP